MNLKELVVEMYDVRANQVPDRLAESQKAIAKFQKKVDLSRERMQRLKQLELEAKLKKADGSPESIQRIQEFLQQLP